MSNNLLFLYSRSPARATEFKRPYGACEGGGNTCGSTGSRPWLEIKRASGTHGAQIRLPGIGLVKSVPPEFPPRQSRLGDGRRPRFDGEERRHGRLPQDPVIGPAAGPILFGLFLALLASEWLLRKHYQLN